MCGDGELFLESGLVNITSEGLLGSRIKTCNFHCGMQVWQC
jgi:hypothetical protein